MDLYKFVLVDVYDQSIRNSISELWCLNWPCFTQNRICSAGFCIVRMYIYNQYIIHEDCSVPLSSTYMY